MDFEETTTIRAVRNARREIKKKIFSYIAAGLGLVAGLAWNDAIKVLIDFFVPDTGNTIIAKLFYAFLLTLVVALILFYGEKSFDEDVA